jgi:hypothetical protein
MASFTAKLGAFDFAQYVRVGPGEGLDPYGAAFEDPVWQDVAIAEGQPLLGIDTKNSEKVWPLYLRHSSKDLLHDLIRDLGREIRYGAQPQRLEWKDSGATDSTFWDVARARFEPSFNFRQSEHGWFAGNLRIWTQPPYGHTATQRLVSSAVATGGVALATIPALEGDMAALAQYTLGMSGLPVDGAGRAVVVAALPNAAYAPYFPPASLSITGIATLVGASGAPASQALAIPTYPLRQSNVARVALAPAVYGGANRVLAAVRPGRTSGMGVWCYLGADQCGPTAIATTMRDGWQLADLGVAAIPTSGATAFLSFGWGQVAAKANDDNLNLQVPAQPAGQLGAVFVLPEDSTAAQVDGLAEVVNGINGVSSATQAASTDDYNSMTPSNDPYYKTPEGLRQATLSGWMLGQTLMQDFRARAVMRLASTPGGFYSNSFRLGKLSTTDSSALQAYWNTAASTPALTLSARVSSPTAVASIFLPLQATSLLNSPTTAWLCEVQQTDDTAWMTLKLANATGVGIYSGGTWGVGATTVPVACLAMSTSMLRALRGPAYFEVSDTARNTVVENFEFAAVSARALPSESYLLDGVTDSAVTTSATSTRDRTIGVQGRIPKLVPAGGRVAAFDAQLDGGPMNDPMSVTIAVRERFVFAR